MKTDYVGNQLEVGDKVIFMQVKYRGFLTGRLVSLSEKTAVIRHPKTNLCSTTTRQFYGQIIKHPDQSFDEMDQKIQEEERAA